MATDITTKWKELQALSAPLRMQKCYELRKASYGFQPHTDTYLGMVLGAMVKYRIGALPAALQMMKELSGTGGGDTAYENIALLAAAYYITEVEPTKKGTLTEHDRRMITALDGVKFGQVKDRGHFVEQCKREGIKTDRQRWWLTKLVQMYRKQVKDQSHVAAAEEWLRTHDSGSDTAVTKAPTKAKAEPVKTPQQEATLFD